VSLDAYKNFAKNKHKIVVGKLEEKTIFRTIRCRRNGYIKVDLKQEEVKIMNWIQFGAW